MTARPAIAKKMTEIGLPIIALQAVVEALQSGQRCDVEDLTRRANIPESVSGQYSAIIRVLIGHYQDLLRAEGDSWESLVRSAHKNRTNYLLFLNQLNDLERQFNAALTPHLKPTTEGVDEIVQRMEHWSETLRRDDAAKIFSN